jgi:hypothetical protein
MEPDVTVFLRYWCSDGTSPLPSAPPEGQPATKAAAGSNCTGTFTLDAGGEKLIQARVFLSVGSGGTMGCAGKAALATFLVTEAVCSAASCPAVVRNECGRGVGEVNAAIPIVVFALLRSPATPDSRDAREKADVHIGLGLGTFQLRGSS